MTDTRDRRQRVRQATVEEIKATARQQMAQGGAANLSFGAIARAMGMTPPALYRYFRNRRALVIALIVDAYDAQAGALEGCTEGLGAEDYAGQFLTFMGSYRRWALEHPEEYAMMHSAAIYDRDLSAEQIQQIARATMRNLHLMVHLFLAAYKGGRLKIPAQYADPPPAVREALTGVRMVMQGESQGQEQTLPLGLIALSFMVWLRAHGLVWQELHGPLPEVLFGAGELYEMEMDVLAGQFGLAAP